jgi:CRP/FNR family transcriptional regulator, cyclic AMP receptor protein
MALIDGLPRSGDATARTHVRLACIDEPHFKNLVRELPDFALSLMKILVERLRANLES